MIFNSLTFLIFIFFVATTYWFLSVNNRLYLLFLCSITFYAFWKPVFALLMLFSAFIDFSMSLLIFQATKKKYKKLFLTISLFSNLGLLFVFKYLYFFSNNLQNLLELLSINYTIPLFNLILPLGISFYTFQTISYTVDVYRGFIKPQKNFILYGCYVTFFPQLVAGPILRANEVIHQFIEKKKFNIKYIYVGIERILYGLFLKTCLADNLAPIVDKGFLIPVSGLSAIDVWTLSFLFGFQIYFDFSAYSHIAIGSAGLMGINFPENFNFPYISTSFKDFWKRWHISLSSWIRDYLYLPLNGLKVHDNSVGGLKINHSQNSNRKTISLFSTWAIMGLWHGANWTFIFWGLYHSTLIYFERRVYSILNIKLSKNTKIIGLVFTLPLAMLGWIPFRADSIEESLLMLVKVFRLSEYSFLGMRENVYLIAAASLLLFFCGYIYMEKIKPFLFSTKPSLFEFIKIVETTILIVLVFIFLRPINQFIYFQF